MARSFCVVLRKGRETGRLKKSLTCGIGICRKIEAPWEAGGEVEDLVRVVKVTFKGVPFVA